MKPERIACTPARKPRLLLLQRHYDASVPAFLRRHVHDHVRCLSVFFDVHLVNRDCDYAELCDRYEPDLALFEAGPNLANSHGLRIRNVRTNDTVVKLALLNADAWCETRAGVFCEMDAWGIEHFASIAVTAPEHMPAVASRLVCWPNFIDPATFRDYGETKGVLVLLTGARGPQYRWRARVFPKLAARYPCRDMAHPGYHASRRPHELHGEPYARGINAALFVPTCGTVAKEVVRKHFEIPGCASCLVTERSPWLEAAGFLDMVNCVMADESDVVDKVDHLLAHPDELARITQAGHDLVHGRHTMEQRGQILAWWKLFRAREGSERIVQRNPFELPVLEPGGGNRDEPVRLPAGLHLQHVADGRDLLRRGEYDAAEARFLEALRYMRKLPEAKLGVAVCRLHGGRAEDALALLEETVAESIVAYRATEPDPVEWAYLIVALACTGRTMRAHMRGRQFAGLRHVELDRARWLAHVLAGQAWDADATTPRERLSVHAMATRSLQEWVRDAHAMLTACGQPALASRLEAAVGPTGQREGAAPSPAAPVGARPARRAAVALLRLIDVFDRPVLQYRARSKWRNARRRVEYLFAVICRAARRTAGRRGEDRSTGYAARPASRAAPPEQGAAPLSGEL